MVKTKDAKAPNGYTLVEAIVAIGILVSGLMGVVVLAVQSLGISDLARIKLQAEYLAQEGIELTRALRDDNSGFFDTLSYGDLAALNSDGESMKFAIDVDGHICVINTTNCRGLLYASQGDKQYSILSADAVTTRFNRTITVTRHFDTSGNPYLEVSALVVAQHRGVVRETPYTLTTALYE